jgi:hypothetical protein
MNWNLDEVQGASVLSLSGYVRAPKFPRLVAALGWVSARGSGPLVLDLRFLRGCSPRGRSALAAACRGWVSEGRPVVMCSAASSAFVLDGEEVHEACRVTDLDEAVAIAVALRSGMNTSCR